MQINSSNDVNFIVVDPQGRKTGVDSRNAKTHSQWVWLREIPRANYSFDGEEMQASMQFLCRFNSPTADGIYTIHIMGKKLSAFNLSLSATGYDSTRIQDAIFELHNIPLDRDSVVTYLFTYHRAPRYPARFEKAVDAKSLVQDLAAMRKLKWIRSQQAMNRYVKLVRTYGMQLQQRDTIAARSTLTTIIRSIIPDSARALTVNAYRSLRTDVEYLLRKF